MTYINSLNPDSTLENNSDILVVDSSIDNYQSLISGIEDAEIILLDPSRNGIEQITETLTNYSEVDSIQIISHGQVGSLQLGSTNLNADNLDSYAEDLAAWSESLTVNGDILLYGCSVGTGSIGLEFINELSQLTNADIAASNDLTGSSELGGDWDLEVTIGDIEADLAIELDIRNVYDSVLETIIDFDDFSDTSELTLNGNVTQVGNVLRLTSTEKRQRGSSFFNQPLAVDANTSFETQFQFQLSGGTDGADGFTFMLQNNSQGVNSLGLAGGGLGYGSITQSLAIEFDTYDNKSDPDNNHISVLQDGDANHALTSVTAPLDLNSGSSLNAWIDYDGVSDLLEVFLADTTVKPETASLSVNIDLASVVGSQAFLGFSAATGGLVNNHDILNWEFATVPPNPGVIRLETSNYNVNEKDGTVDVTILRTQGSNGVVSIDYDTTDDSAIADEDYTAVSGTLTFADGETSKTVTIPIQDDDLVEGNEYFSFTIDNLVGDATLFAPQTALINIIDDETVSEAFIDFDDFSDTSQLTLNGNATQVGNVLRLTSSEAQQKGSSFFNQSLAVDSNTSFETQFQFQLSGGTNGADGFTFMLQNNTEGVNSLGTTGSGLGYRSITQSLAIDFDTYQNPNNGDINNNHISILRDGDVHNALASIASPFDLNSGSTLNAWIDYDGPRDLLEVFLADTTVKPETASLSLNIDLASVVGSQAFLGFSAGTGGLVNNHDILNWEFATIPYNPGVIGLETSNYNVSEKDGTVDVTILRTDGSNGVVFIDYDTVNGSAEGDDYTAVSGTVTFADGETSKTVTIPILDDDLVEGNENFGFTIDNLVGDATLLAPRTAIINIVDDEAGLETVIEFDDFADISELTLNGNATQAGNVLRLTPSETQQKGSSFFNRPLAVDTYTSFETQFQFQLSGGTDGSDGFTFMLQNNTEGINNGLVTLGGPAAGGGLGYVNIPQSLAIEFDTYQNPDNGDINNNHISILRDGDIYNALTSSVAPFDLNSGDFLNAWIDYDGHSDLLEVFLADTTVKPETASLSLNIDLASIVGSQAFLGFSAATGGRFNNHDIIDWEFATNSSLLDEIILPPVESETIISGLNQPIAIEWTPNGDRLFIAEKSGVIKVFQDDQLLPTPFIDISAQVNDPRDRGLLDIAVHPDFFHGSPYVYALYAYDPPEVFDNTGLAGEDGQGNRAGRLTRITADPDTGYTTAVTGSEVVILGTNSTWANFNGFVDSTIDFDEPPAGILADGTNLEDFLAADSITHTIGSVEFGLDGALYVSNGDGTAYNQVDPRTVRVQDIDNLSGKILRIDPMTGDGLPDNPFYNGNPNANRSKVYQYGLRNPFRMTVHPETGQLYVGDVGWTRWEEINAAEPGANFGWPYYEGGSGISLQTRDYEDLPEAQAFYASGQSVTPSIFAADHITDGINAIVLGDIYTGNALPEEYQGDLFFNDLGQGIVRNLNFDESGNVTSVETFATGANIVVQITEGPDGYLYYVDLDDGIVGRWSLS